MFMISTNKFKGLYLRNRHNKGKKKKGNQELKLGTHSLASRVISPLRGEILAHPPNILGNLTIFIKYFTLSSTLLFLYVREFYV